MSLWKRKRQCQILFVLEGETKSRLRPGSRSCCAISNITWCSLISRRVIEPNRYSYFEGIPTQHVGVWDFVELDWNSHLLGHPGPGCAAFEAYFERMRSIVTPLCRYGIAGATQAVELPLHNSTIEWSKKWQDWRKDWKSREKTRFRGRGRWASFGVCVTSQLEFTLKCVGNV